VAIDQLGLADGLIKSGLPEGLSRDGDVSMDGDTSSEGSGEKGSSDVPALEPAPLQAASRTLAAIVSMARARFMKGPPLGWELIQTGSPRQPAQRAMTVAASRAWMALRLANTWRHSRWASATHP
jgi:hypothetical protein